ncbi:MAG: hypothetical protein M3R24_08295 [Chloroflexota bacterium]|nr:hypothetical protein [Chloroflexota bacterium]
MLAHPAVTTVIPGAKHAQQIRETARAGSLPPLTEDELATCAMVIPPGDGRRFGRPDRPAVYQQRPYTRGARHAHGATAWHLRAEHARQPLGYDARCGPRL